MSKIYTKSGDDGTTGLFGSTHIRLPKYHLRVDTYGNIDELNSFIGLLRSNIKIELLKSDEFREHYDFLFIIQNKLFDISSQLSMDGSLISQEQIEKLSIKSEDIENIEYQIDNIENNLEPLRNFIIPGGTLLSSYSHVCRTICRKCERKLCKLIEIDEFNNIDNIIIKYINRLSDYFFVLSRILNKDDLEIIWKK